MDVGIFNVPISAPDRSPYEVAEWNLRLTRWADELGFSEAWFGEHYTIGWEPNPAPELMIAAALRETTQITLAPGAHLLPYHNPIALAHRIAWLDHMAQGRYLVGVGAGAFASDAQLFATGDSNGHMMIEALDVMELIWTATEPFRFDGRFWKVDYPDYDDIWAGPFLKPYQLPRPPIAMAGIAPKSFALSLAGQRGYEPMSIVMNWGTLAQQWETYREAAAGAGHTPDRRNWRITIDFFVAETDREAREAVEQGMLGRTNAEYHLRSQTRSGAIKLLAPGRSLEELTPDWYADNVWLVGSPDTIKRRLTELHELTGGFGTLLLKTADYLDDADAYRRGFELLASEVLPFAATLTPEHAARV